MPGKPAIKHILHLFGKTLLTGVEVGVENGNHAQGILDDLDIAKLYLVDDWQPYMEEGVIHDPSGAYHNVAKRFADTDKIKILRMKSSEAVKKFEDETLDFVYIDANHQYEFILTDITIWYPKIKKGGVICGHDYGIKWDGVTRAVNELIKRTGRPLGSEASDWWTVK